MELRQLYEKWLAGDLDRAQLQELLDQLGADEKAAFSLMDESWNDLERTEADLEQAARPKVRRMPWRWAAAAVFLLVAGATTWFILQRGNFKPATTLYTGNVMPGHDGARIVLGDNSILTIDSLKDGLIAKQGSISIYKENGRIVYRANGDISSGEAIYNQIIADKGRQTTAQLPDGSTVWVNSGSTVRYPLQFSKQERLVTMTGEASFRVIHNTRQPFRVRVKDQVVEDIGTEFNINAYDDEEVIRTTLVEGTASVTTARGKVVLSQGLEAENREGSLSSGQGDVAKAIAWRNGLFSFKHADLKTVLRQLARWYNVEVRYESEVPDDTFTGNMGRELTLADALDNLQRMGVHFRIEEDKRIVVLP